MHDGITFEQLGKRAVVLCTQPFEVTAKNIAKVLGLADYPFVLLDHPLGSKSLQDVDALASIAAQECADILMS